MSSKSDLSFTGLTDEQAQEAFCLFEWDVVIRNRMHISSCSNIHLPPLVRILGRIDLWLNSIKSGSFSIHAVCL